MTTRSMLSRWTLAAGLMCGLAGCGVSAPAPSADGAAANPPRSTDTALPTAAADEKSGTAAAEKELDNLKPPTIVAAKPAELTYTVNAMIGQVNGRPLYASTVLEPLAGQLRAWGTTLSPRDFRTAAAKLVGERIYQIVFDTLFLGEAERHLTENERFGLKVNLRLNREELVRRYGAGSEPLADEEMRKKTGKGLDETLTNVKQSILIRKYQEDVITPRITVSRRDVERFYYDPANYEKYNPKPGRKIRIIRVATSAQATEIDKLLGEGKAFAEVAKERFNQYNRDGGGLMVTKDAKDNTIEFIQGDKVFGVEPINVALLSLNAGEHSPRITTGSGASETYWWVYLDAINEGKQIPLREAQLQIEQQIRGMQYLMLEQRYRKKLFEDAGYNADLNTNNPLAEMAKALVEIATNVYGPAAKTTTEP